MKKILFIIVLNIFLFVLCKKERDPIAIIQNTIQTIDTISSISYNQHLIKNNLQNIDSVVERDRACMFKKLSGDSITGAETHIYYYSGGVTVFEDIYNGDFLIRKNHVENSALFYDLIKYPEIKNSNGFWRKNTPYTIQALLDFTLKNKNDFKIEILNDTIIDSNECFCIKTSLEDKNTSTTYNKYFTKKPGSIEESYFYINKKNYYPQKIRIEISEKKQPEKIIFTDYRFYDIIFNQQLNDELFSNQNENIKNFNIQNISPLLNIL
ncbi:MAG: hypothetical protein JEY96_07100 [Bacteroidales bacterium]|nr:hypothetical protein [Bacteroidales bacterium]